MRRGTMFARGFAVAPPAFSTADDTAVTRRAFIGGVAGVLLAAPLGVRAQPAGVPRIGFLANGGRTTTSSSLESFRRGLADLGWVDGKTVAFDYRWAEGHPERLPALVAELVAAKVDLIVVSGPAAIRAAQQGNTTIPVVFVILIDPVTMGFVRSLARPGGNMTGVASHFDELITKQLQLLKEAVPNLSRVALLHRPESAPSILVAAQLAARNLGLTVLTLKVTSTGDLENAFKVARAERMGAIHVLPSPYFGEQRAALVELAARYRLPACYELRSYVQDGGLMAYGPRIDDMFGRAATYADRILRGGKPGDLAIERPERFELAINLKTASALGMTLPSSLLQRADEVIQ